MGDLHRGPPRTSQKGETGRVGVQSKVPSSPTQQRGDNWEWCEGHGRHDYAGRMILVEGDHQGDK